MTDTSNINPLKEPKGSITTLAVSKVLKELGIKQEAYFFWLETEKEEGMLLPYELLEVVMKEYPQSNLYAAFTTDQLVKMLGSVMISFQYGLDDKIFYLIHYRDPIDGLIQQHSFTIPDGLAGMLYRLIIQKKKPLEEANRWIGN